MNVINNKDIIVVEDGTVLQKYQCNARFVYNSALRYDLSKYPEKYGYWNEFFEILKGQSSISLKYSIQGSERGAAYLDMRVTLGFYSEVIELFLEKSGFNHIIKDSLLVIHVGILPDASVDAGASSFSSYAWCCYNYCIFFDDLPADFENRIKPSGIRSSSETYNFSYYLQEFIHYVSNFIEVNEKILEDMRKLSVDEIVELLKKNRDLDTDHVTSLLQKYYKEGESYTTECTEIRGVTWDNNYWYGILYILDKFFYYGNYPDIKPYYKDDSLLIGYGFYKSYIKDLKRKYNIINIK